MNFSKKFSVYFQGDLADMLSFTEKRTSSAKLAEWSPSDWPESLREMRVSYYKYLSQHRKKATLFNLCDFFKFLFFRRSTICCDVLFATNFLTSH